MTSRCPRKSDARQTSYSYDDVGRLASRVDRNGVTTTYDYDQAGRLIETSSPTVDIDVDHDPLGRPTSITTPEGVVDFAWDDASGLDTQTTTWSGASAPVTLDYQVNGGGQLIAVGGPSSDTAYLYDSQGRLDSVADAVTGTFDFGYDAATGRLATIERPNGIDDTLDFDDAGRLESRVAATGTTVVGRAEYTYNSAGRRDSLTDLAGSHTYSYDTGGRLTAADHPAGYAFTDETFAYDTAGNRSSWTGNPGAQVTYDNADRLLSDATWLYSYDNEGNLTSRTPRAGGNPTTYTWDSNHQLRTVMHSDGSTTSYGYDGLGRRVSIDDRGTIQRLLWSGDNLRASYDNSGAVVSRYVTALDYDSVLAADTNGTVSYPVTDGLGSVTAWTDIAGGVIDITAYSAFGEASNPAPARGTAPFGYTGLALDSTGLIQARARNYDPTTGRFLSEDPLAAANRYPYADNNPISLLDPTGLMAIVEYSETNEPAERSAPAVEQTGQRSCSALSRVASKLDNYMEHMTYRDLTAARLEQLGHVVAVRPGGIPYDHVNEVRGVQRGLMNQVDTLTSTLCNPNLSDADREVGEQLLGRASRMLDRTEGFLPR